MVDVTGKAATVRSATAVGLLVLKPSHVQAMASLPKGDAITVAQIAGVCGAKRCADLIPLCHSIPLSHVEVRIVAEGAGLRIEATTRTDAQTGVEMEAYAAVVVAGITLIDMLKGVDPDLTLTGVQLTAKSGGKQDFVRS